MKLLRYMVTLVKLTYTAAALSLHLKFVTFSATFVIFFVCVLLKKLLVILVCIKWCQVVLICTSLMINGIKYLPMYLLATCMSSLEKGLFESFTDLKIG